MPSLAFQICYAKTFTPSLRLLKRESRTEEMLMYKVLDVIQDSPEWHELRRHHIGASNFAAILGKSKYKSPYMVWEEMVRGKKTETNAAMQRGKDLEPAARAVISSRHGVSYQPAVLKSKKQER